MCVCVYVWGVESGMGMTSTGGTSREIPYTTSDLCRWLFLRFEFVPYDLSFRASWFIRFQRRSTSDSLRIQNNGSAKTLQGSNLCSSWWYCEAIWIRTFNLHEQVLVFFLHCNERSISPCHGVERILTFQSRRALWCLNLVGCEDSQYSSGTIFMTVHAKLWF